MDGQIHYSSAQIKNEIETDLRRAMLGSNTIGNPMLTYFLRMAIEELLKSDNGFVNNMEQKSA
ncbi:hypothetical protein [uncultured Cohaesibacter sp.]|uniref:hypothetical protein n=1 Tax=uncultured Cohaesibacter sp. TaxID=1002546 RepID=UPI002AAB349E|nr:hypothetical protein [uncultured Cohaesibacter sp.]